MDLRVGFAESGFIRLRAVHGGSSGDLVLYGDGSEFEDFPEFHKALGRALRSADYWPYRLEHA